MGSQLPIPLPSNRGKTVLVVDDDPSIRNYLDKLLRNRGYQCRCFSESFAVLSYLSQDDHPADLLLADISMPGLGGMDLLHSVKETYPGLPVVLISGLWDLSLALEALNAGADDYLKKPAKSGEILELVDKYLDPRRENREEEIKNALREFLQARYADVNSSQQLRKLFEKFGFNRYETFQHSARVAAISRLFGQHRRLSVSTLQHLVLGAFLHDIGKVGIPRNILMKPGKLTDEELRAMRKHPVIGHRLLSEYPELQVEADLVYSHHERYDGNGYPRGLRREGIPLGARIFSIVDTLDSMTSNRPYRPAQPLSAARSEILKMSGAQFDPALVEVFLSISSDKIEKIRRAYPDTVTEPLSIGVETLAEGPGAVAARRQLA